MLSRRQETPWVLHHPSVHCPRHLMASWDATRHERELRRMSVSRTTTNGGNVGNPTFFFKKRPFGMVEIPHIRIVILGMVCEIGFTTLSSSMGILQNLLSGCIWMIILADLATFTRCKHSASKTRVESFQKLF